jgi:UDP-N-acetylglucosamine 2-epimerase (non-hydrolysing)
MKIACVVGARPNFVKIAPVIKAFRSIPGERLQPLLIHTGQHYDHELSQVFFDQLEIPSPDFHLDVGPGTPAHQTAQIMERFDALCRQSDFDRVLVVGDVNSTLACAVAAAKCCIPVDHLEAGLRSFDRTMPEEINRIVTDVLSDLCFVTEPSGVENLRKEGHSESKIKLVGNVMIDTLSGTLPAAKALEPWRQFGVPRKRYGLVTLHRPSNVDHHDTLGEILETLTNVNREIPIIFPVHPRTRAMLKNGVACDSLTLCDPLDYMTFVGLMEGASFVITDSGGIQEETTFLNVPCLTLRPNTERPITVEQGSNTLVGNDPRDLQDLVGTILAGKYKKGTIPAFWDGHASERIAAILAGHASQPGESGHHVR